MAKPERLSWDDAMTRAQRNARRLGRSWWACESRYGYAFTTDASPELHTPGDVVRFQGFPPETAS